MSIKGLIISGKFGELVAREKSGERIELGELLVAESKNSKILLQAYDLLYGSQISQSNLELVSGMKLEEESDMSFMDEKLRNYNLTMLKNLISINSQRKTAHSSKSLPDFFSSVREVTKDDLKFLTKPKKSLYVGALRSGSKMVDVDIFLPGEKVFTHHILIGAATGKGKSNLASVMLWDMLKKDYAGILVLDPHDEYYGRNGLGLKDSRFRENMVYYTPNNVPPGQLTLKINLRQIKPIHFNGVMNASPAQKEAMTAYYRKYREDWIEAIVLEKEIAGFMEGTLAVLKRRFVSLLNLDVEQDRLFCNGVFDNNSGKTTIGDICDALEKGRLVVVDTSSFSGSIEILVGSLIATEIFSRYKSYKHKGTLDEKAVVSIFLEEAPRVLGKEVLENGPNIFSTIAREGRKFKIGLTAITQLPSLIPRQILANMNTKIILGIEMAMERQAIIESASQDLSSDSRAIAALDKGEAIISSNFTRFAIPIKIPLFSDFVKKDVEEKEDEVESEFSGINLE